MPQVIHMRQHKSSVRRFDLEPLESRLLMSAGPSPEIAACLDVASPQIAASDVASGDLAAPANPAASQGTFSDQVQVSWEAVNGAASYQVFRGVSNDESTATRIAAGLTATTYDDTSAVPGTLYYYWIRAKNPPDTGDFSTPVSGYVPLAAPANVAASTSLPHHVAVTWDAVAGASAYKVFRSTANDVTTAVKIAGGLTTGSFNDTTASQGAVYFYWVRARNALGAGLFSAAASG
jgi:cellulose 1,4-beta-cellobiosidase